MVSDRVGAFADDAIGYDANDEQARQLASILSPTSTENLIFPGPLGRLISLLPLSEGIPEPEWSIDEPETIQHLHSLYRDAGAEVAVTNTGQACAPVLESLGVNVVPSLLVHAACREAFLCAPLFVVGSIGPCGIPPEEREQALGAYEGLCRALAEGEVHGILIEGMATLSDALVALEAVRRVSDRSVIVSLPFDSDGWMRNGVLMGDAFRTLADAGADAVGVDGVDVDGVVALAPRIAAISREIDRRILVRPTAGEMVQGPEGQTWQFGPADFARAADALRVNSIGLVGVGEGGLPTATGVMADRFFQA